MSFLIVVDKIAAQNSVNVEVLKSRLCPYNSPIAFEKITDRTTLFSTNLVSKQNLNSSQPTPLGLSVEFRVPFNHLKEAGTAWAVIDVQHEQLTVQTDPLGQLPLYIYEDDKRLAITCEQKSFFAIKDLTVGFNFNNTDFRQYQAADIQVAQRLQPGSSIKLDLKNTNYQILKVTPVWKRVKPNLKLTIPHAERLIIDAFKTAQQSYSPRITASLLSGGIDSSLATALVPSVTDTYNLKTKLGDEEAQSQFTAQFLKRRSKSIEFDESQLEQLFKQVTYANELSEGLSAEIFIQLFSLIKAVGRDHKYVLTGYGADYLFGGMLKHKLFMQLTGCTDTETLIDRAVWAKEFSPFYAWQIGVVPVHFYWNEEFIESVLQIPLEFQFSGDIDKYLVRSIAVQEKWLSREIAFRPKLTLTNGTQMNKIFSEHLRLPDEYSYAEKTRKSQQFFSELLRASWSSDINN